MQIITLPKPLYGRIPFDTFVMKKLSFHTKTYTRMDKATEVANESDEKCYLLIWLYFLESATNCSVLITAVPLIRFFLYLQFLECGLLSMRKCCVSGMAIDVKLSFSS